MARAWLVDSRAIAKKVKNATQLPTYQNKDWGAEANRECPNCKYRIDNSDVSLEWPGLPAGVKFDPSDLELLEHLAGKVGLTNSKPHMFIDEFIPTLEEDGGICYTHPENLPGIKKDGNSVHFFHRTSNAYSTGHRKRRKVQSGGSLTGEHVRWHKTGKTRPLTENGVQKGFKKIMVLYKSSKNQTKPDKDNWVMHQYHLGTEEDEMEGEFVVSKIFYQPQTKLTEKNDMSLVNEDTDMLTSRVSPRTPKTNTPHPPRPGMTYPYDEGDDDNAILLPYQKTEDETPQPHSTICHKDEDINPPWWAGESQALEDLDPNAMDASLLCDEVLDSFFTAQGTELRQVQNNSESERGRNDTLKADSNTFWGLSDLDNIDIGMPPDFDLADLQFGSQESITSWLDRL